MFFDLPIDFLSLARHDSIGVKFGEWNRNTWGSRLTQWNNKTNIIRVDIILTLQMLTISFLNYIISHVPAYLQLKTENPILCYKPLWS